MILAFVFRDKVKDWVKEVLQEGMILRYQDDEDALMDWFQETVRSVNPKRRVFESCHKETFVMGVQFKPACTATEIC